MRRNVSFSLTQLGTASALLGALLLLPVPSLAQDDVTLTMARERFKEGVSYFDKKDFAKARVAFLQAYALKKHPAVLLNLAQSELRSGHEADAAKHFAQYLREHREATEAERQGAETGLTAAKALVAEVTLDVDATGAEIYVDGDLEGQAPLPGSIYLAPGSHELQARKDGKTATSEVNASAGQSTNVKLKLAPTPKPRPTVGSEAGAEPLPPSAAAEKAGREREEFIPWLTSTPGAMIGAGIAGVGLLGGGAFVLGSRSAYGAADSVAEQIKEEAEVTDGKRVAGQIDGRGACLDPESWLKTSDRWGTQRTDVTEAKRKDRARQYVDNCNMYTDNVDSGDTFKKLAIVSFAVAGAAAVGTIVYYLVDADTKQVDLASRGPRFVVLPVYQPGFAGGLVSGSF
jgi:PEGA domain